MNNGFLGRVNQDRFGNPAAPFGQGGYVYANDTTAYTGTFVWLYVISDAVFSTFTDSGNSGSAIAGDTIPAGTSIPVSCTAATLTSGTVVLYKAVTI